MYLIYCYINKINNKKYIGLTKRSLEQRERNHISEAYNKNSDKYNTPFKSAIRKYGIENFNKTILDYADTLEDANKKEKYYIKKYNTYCYKKGGYGYNATEGGDGVKKHHKNIVQLSKIDGTLIKTYSSISEAEKELNIGHISECLYKRIPSIGGFCWMYESEYINMNANEIFDYIQIINHRIVQLTKEKELVKIWDSALAASKELNFKDNLIIKVCHGERKSHKNFIWRKYEDFVNNIDPIPKKYKIYKYDENILIKEYNTLQEAGNDNNIIPQVLGRHINTNKKYLNYYWYKKEVSM